MRALPSHAHTAAGPDQVTTPFSERSKVTVVQPGRKMVSCPKIQAEKSDANPGGLAGAGGLAEGDGRCRRHLVSRKSDEPTGSTLPLPLQFLAAWLAVWLGRVLQQEAFCARDSATKSCG
jgi:hypothetical protein